MGFVQHSVRAEDGNMEGTPLTVLEASAAGVPVISTNHGGIPDVIINGKTGFLVEEFDVSGMANNMKKLLQDKDLPEKLGRAGKENIKNNYLLKYHIKKIDEILLNAVQK